MGATVLVIVGVEVCADGNEIDGHSCWRRGWRWALMLVLATRLEVAARAGGDESGGVLVLATSLDARAGNKIGGVLVLATRLDACAGNEIGGVLVLATRSDARADDKIGEVLVLATR